MEYGLLVVISLCLGSAVCGGLLSAWSCHRRLLALEETLKVILTAYDDRLNQLSKIVVRQDKTEAAKIRWSGKAAQDEALAKSLTAAAPALARHPWDPRLWGKDG
jgi:hypothetical protein